METPAVEPLAEEAPTEEAPVEEAPAEEAPVEEAAAVNPSPPVGHIVLASFSVSIRTRVGISTMLNQCFHPKSSQH